METGTRWIALAGACEELAFTGLGFWDQSDTDETMMCLHLLSVYAECLLYGASDTDEHCWGGFFSKDQHRSTDLPAPPQCTLEMVTI